MKRLTAKEQQLYQYHLAQQQLKHTRQRQLILDEFLKKEGHIGIEEFYQDLKRKYPFIGYTTVYRTLKLLAAAGLAREISFQDGLTRFEHSFAHPHHDHLICLSCGKSIEFCHPGIELLQDKIVKQYRFLPEQHKLEIYGYCKKCQMSKSKCQMKSKT
jgi:Fur family transcriptional regulator, ferric uptake regulator